MLIGFLTWLCGQALIGCAIASAVWARLLVRRWRDPARLPLADDIYRWIVGGVVIVLIGVVAGAAARVETALTIGQVALGRAPELLIVSLTLIAGGSAVLVWGSTISRAPTPWRTWLAMSAAWLVATIIWRL